jgi:hypothetical protein
MRARSALAAVLGVALLLIASVCPAQFPDQMNYQVMLTDDFDQPLADQSVELVFRLYYAESGGSPFWTETHSAETNSIGVVSVALGSISPFSSYAFVPQWLEVQVNGEVMSPRRQLLEAPYARAAARAERAFSASELGTHPAEHYALYSELSTPGTINSPSNPLEWTMLKNVPAGFADGVDDAGGGDGHSLDASDGNPTDVVRVDADGMVESGFSSELAASMSSWGHDFALDAGGANVWGGILAESRSASPFEVGVMGGTNTNAGVLGAAYDTTGYMWLIDGKSGVAGSVHGEGYAGSFIADNDEDAAVYCTNTGQGNVLHAYGWTSDTGYTGYFEGGSGVVIQRGSGIPALNVEHLAISGWGDAAYFYSNSGVSSETWTLNSVCFQGSAGRFEKLTDEGDIYAVAIHSPGSSSEGLYVDGTIVSTGSLARGIETPRGPVPVFGMSSPDVEVVASGTGRLMDGAARIDFDDVFSESITGATHLRVTATPIGGWSALYIGGKDADGFDLRSESGDRNIDFDWVAVGRARGHERRPEVTIPDPVEEARIAEAKASEMEARRPSRNGPPELMHRTKP